jgi:hypothetical protein
MPEQPQPDETSPMVRMAQEMQDQYRVLLDALDGLVAETVRRGWTQHQARALVLSTFLPHRPH